MKNAPSAVMPTLPLRNALGWKLPLSLLACCGIEPSVHIVR
jgi:hypothetical protein